MGNELSTKITSCCVDKPKSKYEDDDENDTNNMHPHGHRKLAHIRSISPKQQSVQYCITPLFTEDEENNLPQEEKDERCQAHHDQILIRRELIDFFVDEATARKMLLYQHGFTMRLMRQQMNEEYDELMMMLEDEARNDDDYDEDQQQEQKEAEQEGEEESDEEEVYSNAAEISEDDVSENRSDREGEEEEALDHHHHHHHHHHNESPLEGKDTLDETAPALDVDQDTNDGQTEENKEDGKEPN